MIHTTITKFKKKYYEFALIQLIIYELEGDEIFIKNRDFARICCVT